MNKMNKENFKRTLLQKARDFSFLSECANCPFCKNEDANGEAWCDLMDIKTNCTFSCNLVYCYEFMTQEKALKVLHYHQKWRRYNGKKYMPMMNPAVLGFAIDEAMRCMRSSLKQKQYDHNR